MGLTQRLGTIPLAIQTDSSNNVGIGGAANASYKLAVTGAGLFTGALTASTTFTLDGTKKVFLRSNQGTGGGLLSGSSIGAMGNFSIYSDDGVAGDILGMYYWNGSTYRSSLQFANVSSGSSNLILMKDGGNVGISTTNPQAKLHVEGDVWLANNRNLYFANSGVAAGAIRFFNSTTLSSRALIGSYFNIADEGNLEFMTGGAVTRMVIRSGGNVGIATSNPQAAFQINGRGGADITFQLNDESNIRRCFYIPNQYYGYMWAVGVVSNGGKAFSFGNQDGSEVGTIVINSSSVAYNTTSDYRLKKDLKDFNGLDILSKVKFYDFAWKLDNTRTTGVIAHELQEVVPYAVNGEKDAIGKDDKPSYQGVDYSKLVAIMGKAIQELSAKVTALENK